MCAPNKAELITLYGLHFTLKENKESAKVVVKTPCLSDAATVASRVKHSA